MLHINVTAALRTKRPDNFPMTGRITRLSKGRYVLDMRFAASRRPYGSEIINAASKRDAVKKARALYPYVEVKR